MNNIEIKAALPDRAAVEHALNALPARREWTRQQRDVFFRVPRGYLKLRSYQGGNGGELIAYSREPGFEPRASDYDIVRVASPDQMEAVLGRSLGIRGVVEKTRTLYLWRHTRIHLDQVSGLGAFLELESVVSGISREEALGETRKLIKTLAVARENLLDRPYLELLEQGRPSPA